MGHRTVASGTALTVLVAVSVASCADDPPPPMGRNLGWSAFDRRVQERFPIGANEQELLAELRKERFRLEVGTTSLHYPAPGQFKSSATYTAVTMFCKTSWTILWSTDNGRITAIAGDVFPVCL